MSRDFKQRRRERKNTIILLIQTGQRIVLHEWHVQHDYFFDSFCKAKTREKIELSTERQTVKSKVSLYFLFQNSSLESGNKIHIINDKKLS